MKDRASEGTESDFDPADDLRHAPDDSGRMRDSLFWQTTLPEQKLGFQAYLYLTAAGSAGFNVVLWNDGAEPLLLDAIRGPLDPGIDLDDFEFQGLHLVQAEFGRTASLRYESERIRLAFDFTGLHAPFSYHRNPDGIPRWFALDRFEQSGWIKGFIEFGGRRLELDRMGHRDHSWGNRDWGVPQHWKWFIAYTPDGSCIVNGWIWIARGEWGVGGYVRRDGKLIPIHGIKQRASYDPDMTQRRLSAEILDADGRTTLLALDRYGVVKLPSRDKYRTLIMEAACTAVIDGRAGAGQFETQWSEDYLDRLIESDARGKHP